MTSSYTTCFWGNMERDTRSNNETEIMTQIFNMKVFLNVYSFDFCITCYHQSESLLQTRNAGFRPLELKNSTDMSPI